MYPYTPNYHKSSDFTSDTMSSSPRDKNMPAINTNVSSQLMEQPFDYKKIPDFISGLNQLGFVVQEGKISYIDIIKLCSEGMVNSCLGNNVGAPYAICQLPPAPNQDPSVGQEPPLGFIPDSPGHYPANIDFIAPGVNSKLRPDEAVVLIGWTPPRVLYYCFRSYISFVENKPGKDYSGYITVGNEATGYYHMIFTSLGDQLNNYNIHTENTPNGAPGEPYTSPTIIISTADRNINHMIRSGLETAGFSSSLMNDDNIPIELVNMGLEAGKDAFIYMMRMALWAQQEAGNQYLKNLDRYVRVFRITPTLPPTISEPWPVPTLKIRETGITEYQVVPYARDDLDYLRSEIIKKYADMGYVSRDLELGIGIPDNYNAILRDFNVYGDNRDAVYFKTEDFQLTSDDDFLIVYGINHERTGKAIYSNASFYGVTLFNGVAGAFSTVQFPDTAAGYFPAGYENSGYYYVYKMARKATDDNTVIIPYSTGNPLGKAYGVDNHQDCRIVFRVYLDQTAMVGPYVFDIIWDQVLLFTRKNAALNTD